MPVERICQLSTCLKPFLTKPANIKLGKALYCSAECRNQARKKQVPMVCAHCGTAFSARQSQPGRKYCSHACSEAASRGRQQVVYVECICTHCAKPFSVVPSRVAKVPVQYCSRVCKHEAMKKRVPCVCEYCQKPFEVWVSQLHYRTPHYCSHQCHGQAIRFPEEEKRERRRTQNRASRQKRLKERGVPMVCRHCHQPFVADPNTMASKPPQFCSRRCKSTALAYAIHSIQHHLSDHDRKARKKLSQARYRLTHRLLITMASKKRRSLKLGALICDFTHDEWLIMQAHYDHRCVYCGKRYKGKLTQDHITPLSKGGNHTKSNIVPACLSCNARKHAGPPLKPVQPLLL